jgi:hypothetical protein
MYAARESLPRRNRCSKMQINAGDLLRGDAPASDSVDWGGVDSKPVLLTE